MPFKVKTITPDGITIGQPLIVNIVDLVEMLHRLTPDERVSLEVTRIRF